MKRVNCGAYVYLSTSHRVATGKILIRIGLNVRYNPVRGAIVKRPCLSHTVMPTSVNSWGRLVSGFGSQSELHTKE